jgi:hypothetical protein
MNEKIRPDHLERAAYVYVRQSSLQQVRHHREGQQRQYGLAERARQVGFARVVVIDDDLGVSGTGRVARPGFGRLLTAVCEGTVGAVFALEASRLARNNRDWHHLIDLCGMTETVLVDDDGIYDPRLINDRLLLGLNRPDSYNTSCSTSRGTLNCPEIRQQLRVALTSRDTVAAADIFHMRRHERTTERGTPDAAFSQTTIFVSESFRNPPWASAASGLCFAPLRRGGRYTPRVEM